MVAPAPSQAVSVSDDNQAVVVYSDASVVSNVVNEVPTPVTNAITLQHLINAIPNLCSEQGVVITVRIDEGLIYFSDVDSEEITTLNIADIAKDYTF